MTIALNKDSNVKEIPFGTLEGIPEHGAFVAIFCRDLMPYVKYAEATAEQKPLKTNAILMIFRWDQSTGFLGGKVNKGESLDAAAVREAGEEAHVNLEKEELYPICSHQFLNPDATQFASHLYAVERTPDEFLAIWKNSIGDPYISVAENRGIKVVTTELADTNYGLAATLAGQLQPSVLEEVLLLAEKFQLVTPEHLDHLRAIAAWKDNLAPMPLPPQKPLIKDHHARGAIDLIQ